MKSFVILLPAVPAMTAACTRQDPAKQNARSLRPAVTIVPGGADCVAPAEVCRANDTHTGM